MNGAAESERGWYPDYLFRGGRVESGVALFADPAGVITRFSSRPADLARAQRLAGRAIFPGFVNAHSHAFQRAIRGRTEERTSASSKDSFWTWRETMYRFAMQFSPEDLFDVSRMAFLEMLKAGITTVGEFHYLLHAPDGMRYGEPNLLALQVMRAAAESGVRIALLRTAYARAGWQTGSNPNQARFLTVDPNVFLADTEALMHAAAHEWAADRAWVGVAPHSVRAVPLPYLLQLARFTRERKIPLHMHVAEQPAEVAACLNEYGVRPVELLRAHGLLDENFTAIHATHATPEEIAFMQPSNICACPTTERNLGDGTAPADRWAAAGVNVCLGTDSNVQIDPAEDARELEYHLRLARLERAILPASALLHYATEGGRRSLHAPGGDLHEGRAADFLTLDLDHASVAGAGRETLLSHLVFAAGRGAIRDVFVGGRPLIEDRAHALEGEIHRRFHKAMQRLWSSA